MSTLTLTRINTCTTGEHFTLVATGDIAISAHYNVNDFLAPLTAQDKADFLRLIVRFAKLSRTANQVKTALNNGVTVTI